MGSRCAVLLAFFAMACGDTEEDQGDPSSSGGVSGTDTPASGGTGADTSPAGGTGGDPSPSGGDGGAPPAAGGTGGEEPPTGGTGGGTGGCAGGSHECDGECVSISDPDHCVDCEPCPEDPNGLGTRVCRWPPECSLECPDGSLLCGDACAPCPSGASMDTVACSADATCVTCGDAGNPCIPRLAEVRVSTCGGFNPGLSNYCEAERLFWRYSTNDTVLYLEHWRFVAPCEADIEVAVQLEEGVYHVVETDAAQAPDDCLCAFDTEFHFAIPDTRLTLEVGGQLFEIDPSLSPHNAIVDDAPTPYCE